jgi:hypothetical protein
MLFYPALQLRIRATPRLLNVTDARATTEG